MNVQPTRTQHMFELMRFTIDKIHEYTRPNIVDVLRFEVRMGVLKGETRP